MDGKEDELAQDYHFFAVTFDRKTKQYNYLVWQPVRSMKKGMEFVTKAIYKNIVKPNKDMAFLITCRETVPLYCSEGDMTDSTCKGMIGYALIEGWLVADKSFINRAIPKTSNKFEYVAYMTTNKTDDKVVKLELGKGWKKAIQNYE